LRGLVIGVDAGVARGGRFLRFARSAQFLSAPLRLAASRAVSIVSLSLRLCLISFSAISRSALRSSIACAASCALAAGPLAAFSVRPIRSRASAALASTIRPPCSSCAAGPDFRTSCLLIVSWQIYALRPIAKAIVPIDLDERLSRKTRVPRVAWPATPDLQS
jgi:hypothetical protein